MKSIKFRGRLTSNLSASLVASLFAVVGWSSPGLAQTPILEAGNAIVTGFSGTASLAEQGFDSFVQQDFETVFIDPNSPSLSVLDLQRLPMKTDTDTLANQTKFRVLAQDIGQVFAVTLDNAEHPNIYAAASSAFGLQIVGENSETDEDSPVTLRLVNGQPGAQWADGQFGGLRGGGPGSLWKIDGTSGEISLFASITSNSGPGFGGLTFSALHRQFYLSDLDDGLIYRLSYQGKILSQFNHGIEGRAASGLEPIADDTLDRVDIGLPSFHAQDPSSWGMTAKSRRVHALAVHKQRLYYSVSGQGEVWSIQINSETGDFSGESRLELITSEGETTVIVSDIEFSATGEMLIAERGEVVSTRDYRTFVSDQQTSVRQFQRSSEADPTWVENGQFSDPARTSEGAVAIGLSYQGDNNHLDKGTCQSGLWFTLSPTTKSPGADNLGSVGSLEFRQTGADGVSFVNTAQSFDPLSKGRLGDVDIFEGDCVSTPEKTSTDPDLELSIAPETRQCELGEICSFTIRIKNHGPSDFVSPLTVRARSISNVIFDESADNGAWACKNEGNEISCNQTSIRLVPGANSTLLLKLIPQDDQRVLELCSALKWSDIKIDGLDQRFLDSKKSSVRELQRLLTKEGYKPGPVDGVMGNKTRNAIREFQRDNDLPITGQANEDVMLELTGGTTSESESFILPGGDRLFENNQDCDAVYVMSERHEESLSAMHANQLSAWHRDSRSAIHNPRITRIHRSHDSAWHQEENSRFRNPKRVSKHEVLVSKLHRTRRSLWHVKGMSDTHNPGLSSLHRKYLSAWHLPQLTRLHHPKLSKFHSTDRSNSHIKDRSKIHRQLISNLHLTVSSSLHEKSLSKVHSPEQSDTHQVARSQFHQTGRSKDHIKHQSLQHQRSLSLLHRKQRSSWHKTGTTAIHQPQASASHNLTVSSFHQQTSSRLHAKITSELNEFSPTENLQSEAVRGKSGFRLTRIHLLAKSRSHKKQTSQIHWKTASKKHDQSISTFHQKQRSYNHKTGNSAYHNRLLSRAHQTNSSSAHDQSKSLLHETNRSQGHNRLVSKFHQNQKSTLHLKGRSTYHKRRLSAGHGKRVSKFHEKDRSDNHSSKTSKYHHGTVSRLHIKKGSRWHKLATSEIHDPTVSASQGSAYDGHERNLSRFHQSFDSSLHRAKSSRLHHQRLSQMHLRYKSAWHRSSTSVFRIPTQPAQPLPGLESLPQSANPTFHLPSKSLQNGTQIKVHRTFQSRSF
ncbi:peptidoglycan-binding protein [Alphaproteobacteria bacterium]|nr:peptidoglycan-binding protein [Alphaproteobacteria bacterium]